MSDFDLSDIEHIAQRYENDTISYARENPVITQGMIVNVFNCDNPNNCKFIGKGRVIYVTWDAFYMQHICDVVLESNNKTIQNKTTHDKIILCFEGQLERVTIKPQLSLLKNNR